MEAILQIGLKLPRIRASPSITFFEKHRISYLPAIFLIPTKRPWYVESNKISRKLDAEKSATGRIRLRVRTDFQGQVMRIVQAWRPRLSCLSEISKAGRERDVYEVAVQSQKFDKFARTRRDSLGRNDSPTSKRQSLQTRSDGYFLRFIADLCASQVHSVSFMEDWKRCRVKFISLLTPCSDTLVRGP